MAHLFEDIAAKKERKKDVKLTKMSPGVKGDGVFDG
jgi:hypothetical protein